MAELKPCPFCGSTKLKIDKKSVKVAYTEFGRVERHTYSVRCMSCFARGGAVGGKVIPYFRLRMTEKDLPEWVANESELEEKAIKAWNTRTPKERGGEK